MPTLEITAEEINKATQVVAVALQSLGHDPGLRTSFLHAVVLARMAGLQAASIKWRRKVFLEQVKATYDAQESAMKKAPVVDPAKVATQPGDEILR